MPVMSFDPKNPEDLAELRRLHAETPPGPWRAGRMDTESYEGTGAGPYKNVYRDDPGFPPNASGTEYHPPVTVARGEGEGCRPIAAFIAVAHEAVPALLDEIARLRSEPFVFHGTCARCGNALEATAVRPSLLETRGLDVSYAEACSATAALPR